jgi:hypothetical protein
MLAATAASRLHSRNVLGQINNVACNADLHGYHGIMGKHEQACTSMHRNARKRLWQQQTSFKEVMLLLLFASPGIATGATE